MTRTRGVTGVESGVGPPGCGHTSWVLLPNSAQTPWGSLSLVLVAMSSTAPLSDGTFGGNNVPLGRARPNNGRGAAGLRDPGRPGPQEILLFFTCALKQTQAPVYFLVDCILEDGGGFPTPAV